MIVVSLAMPKGFGQLTPEDFEAELARRGIYRSEGIPPPALPAPEIPEGPQQQVVVVPPEVRPPTYIEPYLPVIPRGEEPGAEEWQQYGPYTPPEAPPEKKPVSKTALIVGAAILGGLLLFGSRGAAGRPIPAAAPIPERAVEFEPAEEEGEYEF